MDALDTAALKDRILQAIYVAFVEGRGDGPTRIDKAASNVMVLVEAALEQERNDGYYDGQCDAEAA